MSPGGVTVTINGKTVSLVLGSGGARGMAHIGIIRELENRGATIGSIAGCSIGALVGGVYAAGKLDEFEKWVCAIKTTDIVSLLDIAWEKNGLVKGDRIIEALVEFIGDTRIEDLDIPFTAVAADIAREKEVWLNSGSLSYAIRASISLPLFFTPVRSGNSLLIDGGVLNPVPIAPTFRDETDITIAVNLGGAPVDKSAAKAIRTSDDHRDKSGLNSVISDWIDNLADVLSNAKSEWGMYDIGNQAFDVMQGTIARQKLAAYPPDYTIEIPRNACGTLEFDLADPMIRLGREKAIQVLDALPG